MGDLHVLALISTLRSHGVVLALDVSVVLALDLSVVLAFVLDQKERMSILCSCLFDRDAVH